MEKKQVGLSDNQISFLKTLSTALKVLVVVMGALIVAVGSMLLQLIY